MYFQLVCLYNENRRKSGENGERKRGEQKVKRERILSVWLVLSIVLSCITLPAFAQTQQNYGGRIPIDKSKVTGGTGYKGSSYLNAVDKDFSTFYDGLQGQFVQIALDKAYDISAVAYMARSNTSDLLGRMTGCYFEGSNDGTNWTRIYTITTPVWDGVKTVKIPAEEFENPSATTVQYIRFAAPAEQYCNVTEIELYSMEVYPEPEPEPEPTKEPNPEYIFYDNFLTYRPNETVIEKEGWKFGGSAIGGHFEKKIDKDTGDAYAEYFFGTSQNSSWMYNSFDAVTDTVVVDFDLRMTAGKGYAGVQKSGSVANQTSYTYGIGFDSSLGMISAVSENSEDVFTTNCYAGKWYHIKMEVDVNTKKANTFVYDGDKALGYVRGIGLKDVSAGDIGNIIVTLERNLSSKCDIAHITVKADSSKSVNDDYELSAAEDTVAPVRLVYGEDFSEYEDGEVTDWSHSGSANGTMRKYSDADSGISYAQAWFGDAQNSKSFWTNLSVKTTVEAEFKLRCSGGSGIVFFSSEGGNLHNRIGKIASIGMSKDKVYLETANGNADIGSNDGWYTFQYTIDNVSKLYDVEVLNSAGNSVLKLSAQPYIESGATAVNVLAVTLDKNPESKIDITDIKIHENIGKRILPGFFIDVNDSTTSYRSDIEYLFENGYLDELAQEDSENFRPSDIVTREEVAMLVAKVLCIPKGHPYSKYNGAYSDVEPENIYADYIQTLKDFAIIDGETFSPAENSSPDDVADMIWKAYCYKTNADSTANALDECINSKIIPDTISGTVQRDQAVHMMNNLRKLIEKSNVDNAEVTDITALGTPPDHKLSLWYNQPAWMSNPPEKYNKIDPLFQEKSLPIGNGHMGATVYGAPQVERIQFNDDTFFGGEYQDKAEEDAANGKTDRVENYHKVVDLLKGVQSFNDSNMTQARGIGDRNLVDSNLTATNYLNAGNLYIKHMDMPKNSVITAYRRELDLEEATARVQFTYDGVNYTREFFADYPDNVIAMKLSADTVGSLNLMIRPEEHHETNNSIVATDDLITMKGNADAPSALAYEVQIKVEANGGTQRTGGDRIFVENADEVVLYLKTGTEYNLKNFPGFKNTDPQEHHRKVSEGIQKASELGYDRLKENHLADYQEIFQRVDLNLGNEINNDIPTDTLRQNYGTTGNKMLDSLFFQYGRYMLIASSRNGSLPANLQGVWNSSNTPSWGSGYTVNVNTEMNYWPAGVTNMKETMMALIDFMDMVAKSGQKTAKAFYGIDNGGWVCHSGVTPYGYTGPSDAIRYGLTPGSSAWLCQNLWDFYEFTQDEQILSRVYPIIKGNVLFFKEQLVLDKNGKYQTGPSISPEQGPMMLGVKYDMQLVYELFTNFLKAAELTGETDTALVEDIKNKRAKMDMPWEIGQSQNGQLMEWDLDIDDAMYNAEDPHRHISHLMALYPTSQINRNTPALMDAVKRTMNLRGDEATGWSMAMKTLIWTRIVGDDGSGTGTTGADHAYRILRNQLTTKVYDNLFDAHAPFQADGNYGATAAMCEFVMQSGTGVIDVLPALPTAWQPQGEMKGLVARGGFEMDIAWKNGKATKIEALSTAGGECTLSYPYLASDATVLCDGQKIDAQRNGNSFTFNTEKGKTYSVDLGSGMVYDYEISDIVYDSGDSPVAVECAETNGKVKEVVLTRHADSDIIAGNMLVALYDADGALRRIKTVDVDTSQYVLNTSVAVGVNMDLPSDTAEGFHTKAFLWNSVERMTPVTCSYTKK